MDVTKKTEIEAARKIVEDMVGERGLTLLINNAGVLQYSSFFDVTTDNLLYHFNTNVVGQVLVFQEMLPLLQRAASLKTDSEQMSVTRAAVINISSVMGSMTKLYNFPSAFGFQISKTALNMIMRVAASQIKDQGILVVQVSPGWVKTDTGTNQALFGVEESVSAILDTIHKLDNSHHGHFVHHNGDNIPF